MTDVANVYCPEGMKVDNVTFNEVNEQIRDEFGMGYIGFDLTGEIKAAEYYDSCYGNPIKDVKGYEANIKEFTGIFDLGYFAIIALRGQLVFGLGCALPTAIGMFISYYRHSNNWEGKNNHTASLAGEDIDSFEEALTKYTKALLIPIDVELKFEDIIDDKNLLFKERNGHLGRDEWVKRFHDVREFYQLGVVSNPDSSLEDHWDSSYFHGNSRELPTI